MRSRIQVKNISVEDKSSLKVEIAFSRNLRYYFRKKSFKITYSEDISETSRDILSIPALAGLICIAWLAQSEVYIDYLDEDYYHSLHNLLNFFQTRHPELKLQTKIHTNLIKNKYTKPGVGLLFSGGVDSLYSYYTNRHRNPELFTVIGSEIPHDRSSFITKVIKLNKGFGEKHGVKSNSIVTDYREFINEGYITSKYYDHLGGYSFYEGFCLSIFLTGICAPLTINKLDKLLVSSGLIDDADNMYGSCPQIDEKIKWANLNVIHEGLGVKRFEKIRYLYEPLKKEDLTIRVCNHAPIFLDKLNCNRCEKCYRNMLMLLYNGLNPGSLGFDYEPITLTELKKRILSGEVLKSDDLSSWKDLQQTTPVNKDDKILKDFTDWYRGYDLEKAIQKNGEKDKKYLAMFSFLPNQIRKMIRIIYYKRKLI